MQNLNKMIKIKGDNYDFSSIAELLLNNSILKVKNESFYITEIEFYYSAKNHNDCAIHGNENQLESNTWYVHTKGRGGIDITFGNKNKKEFGGILIRGIQSISKSTYIDGPTNTLKYILKILNTDRNNLRAQLSNIDMSVLQIVQSETKDNFLFQGPRIGLVQAHNEYLVSPYRYITDVSVNHKFVEKSNVYCYSLKINKNNKFSSKLDIDKYKQSLNKQIFRNKAIINFLDI